MMSGGGWLGKNDITQELAGNIGMQTKQKANKAEELTYLYLNIELP